MLSAEQWPTRVVKRHQRRAAACPANVARGDANHRIYERRSVAARYAGRSQLQPAEAAILARYEPEISGASILDIGVGGGRTTPFLVQLSTDYLGVDYSSEMISRCRARFPSIKFEVQDARDLSAFADASFDFILFSYNGMDEMVHAERLHVLRQICRILKPAGLFAFSTHNRDFAVPRPWDLAHLAVSPIRHPKRFAKRLASYPLGIANYLLRAHRIEDCDEYRIAVDVSYMYSLVHYHITPEAQKRQLEAIGFCDVEAVGNDGGWLSLATSTAPGDPWIHYVSRRRS